MKIRIGIRTRVGLLLLAVASIPWLSAWAQNFPGPWVNLTAGGIIPLPPPPPEGAWGEVIMSNSKWLVIQNHEGQQFPVAWDSVQQYLVRWPTQASALTNNSLVEAVGLDVGSNTIQTDHIDVYEGTDQTLVTPTIRSLLPANREVTVIDPTFQRLMNGFEIANQNTLYGWAYPIDPGTNGIPGQLYLVGNALHVNPLQIGVPGNNIAAIVNDAGPITMTQVTRGTPSFAQKGDFVFLTPVDLTAKTLVLEQLVLYKKIARNKFTD